MSAKFLLLSREEVGYDDTYTVVLTPGEVRYIRVNDFFRADVDDVIAEIQRASDEPKVESPHCIRHNISDGEFGELDFWDLDDVLNDIEWADRLRVHHAIGG